MCGCWYSVCNVWVLALVLVFSSLRVSIHVGVLPVHTETF